MSSVDEIASVVTVSIVDASAAAVSAPTSIDLCAVFLSVHGTAETPVRHRHSPARY
jgi:hypothetical protein